MCHVVALLTFTLFDFAGMSRHLGWSSPPLVVRESLIEGWKYGIRRCHSFHFVSFTGPNHDPTFTNPIWGKKNRRAPTCGHLMSQPTTPAVDHHTHLAFVVDAHLFGCIVIVDLIYHLNLGVVIACSQCPELRHNRLCSRHGLNQHWSF